MFDQDPARRADIPTEIQEWRPDSGIDKGIIDLNYDGVTAQENEDGESDIEDRLDTTDADGDQPEQDQQTKYREWAHASLGGHQLLGMAETQYSELVDRVAGQMRRVDEAKEKLEAARIGITDTSPAEQVQDAAGTSSEQPGEQPAEDPYLARARAHYDQQPGSDLESDETHEAAIKHMAELMKLDDLVLSAMEPAQEDAGTETADAQAEEARREADPIAAADTDDQTATDDSKGSETAEKDDQAERAEQADADAKSRTDESEPVTDEAAIPQAEADAGGEADSETTDTAEDQPEITLRRESPVEDEASTAETEPVTTEPVTDEIETPTETAQETPEATDSAAGETTNQGDSASAAYEDTAGGETDADRRRREFDLEDNPNETVTGSQHQDTYHTTAAPERPVEAAREPSGAAASSAENAEAETLVGTGDRDLQADTESGDSGSNLTGEQSAGTGEAAGSPLTNRLGNLGTQGEVAGPATPDIQGTGEAAGVGDAAAEAAAGTTETVATGAGVLTTATAVEAPRANGGEFGEFGPATDVPADNGEGGATTLTTTSGQTNTATQAAPATATEGAAYEAAGPTDTTVGADAGVPVADLNAATNRGEEMLGRRRDGTLVEPGTAEGTGEGPAETEGAEAE